jgi:hypothetical protein
MIELDERNQVVASYTPLLEESHSRRHCEHQVDE